MGLTIFALAMAAAAPVPGINQPATQPPAGSCQVLAGELANTNNAFPLAYPGAQIVSAKQFNRIIRDAPYGQPIVIDGGNFSGWRFGKKWKSGKRYLSNVCFLGSNLTDTDWSNAKTSGIGFINVDLTGADMSEAEMPYTLFRNTSLENVTAKEADFSYGRLDGGWKNSIANLNLEEADLSGFRFVCGVKEVDGCPFERKGINARRANLTNASIFGFYANDIDLSQARIDGIELGVDQLDQLNGAQTFGPVRLRGGPFVQTATASEFGALRRTLKTPVAVDTRCNDPVDPLMVAICADTSRQLLAISDDIAILSAGKILPKGPAKKFSKSRQKCFKQKTDELRTICLLGIYDGWRNELVAGSPPPSWAQIPTKIIFARSNLPINNDPTSKALWSRFGAVVAGSASAYIAAQSNGSNAVNMRGKATAVDGDYCEFDVPNLVYTKGNFGLKTVTIEPVSDGKKKKKPKKPKADDITPFAFFLGEEAQILADRAGPKVFVGNTPSSTDGVRCTGPSPFGKMQQLQVDEAAFDLIWQQSAITKTP
jgi:uncharacterized protein YjbI with pentapeptide repeats